MYFYLFQDTTVHLAVLSKFLRGSLSWMTITSNLFWACSSRVTCCSVVRCSVYNFAYQEPENYFAIRQLFAPKGNPWFLKPGFSSQMRVCLLDLQQFPVPLPWSFLGSAEGPMAELWPAPAREPFHALTVRYLLNSLKQHIHVNYVLFPKSLFPQRPQQVFFLL